MARQKTTLSFTEARLEIEGAPPYEYDIYIRETGEMRKARCAGGESFSLIAADARALSLLDTDEKQTWRILQQRRAIERIYKAFPPELRYIHEHPVLDSWKNDAKAARSGPRLLSPDMACLRTAAHQLMNHGIKKEHAFELLARILPELASRYFEISPNLKEDANHLCRRYEESERLLNSVKKGNQKNLIKTLNQIDMLQKELDKSRKRYACLMDESPPAVRTERKKFTPSPEELDFREIEVWAANEDLLAGEKFALAGASKET